MVSWTSNLGLVKTGENPAYDNNFVEIDTRYADLNNAIKSLQNRFGINNIAFNKNKYYLTAVSNEWLSLKPESDGDSTEYVFSNLIDGEAYVVFSVNQMGKGLTESTDPTKLKLTNNDLVVKLTKEINGIFQPYFVVIQNVVGFGYVPYLTQLENNKIGVEFKKVTATDIEEQVDKTFDLEPLVGPAITGTVEVYKSHLTNNNSYTITFNKEYYEKIPYEDISIVAECYIATSSNLNERKKIEVDCVIKNSSLTFKFDPYYTNLLKEEEVIIIHYKRFLTPKVTSS